MDFIVAKQLAREHRMILLLHNNPMAACELVVNAANSRIFLGLPPIKTAKAVIIVTADTPRSKLENFMLKRWQYPFLTFVMVVKDPMELPTMVTAHLDIAICGPGVSRQVLSHIFKTMVMNGDNAKFFQAYDDTENILLSFNGFSKL